MAVASPPSETAAYITTVGDDRSVRLPDSVPPGATVAVVVLSASDEAAVTVRQRKAEAARKLIDLFKEIQAAPTSQVITEEEIQAEIAAFRAEQPAKTPRS